MDGVSATEAVALGVVCTCPQAVSHVVIGVTIFRCAFPLAFEIEFRIKPHSIHSFVVGFPHDARPVNNRVDQHVVRECPFQYRYSVLQLRNLNVERRFLYAALYTQVDQRARAPQFAAQGLHGALCRSACLHCDCFGLSHTHVRHEGASGSIPI